MKDKKKTAWGKRCDDCFVDPQHGFCKMAERAEHYEKLREVLEDAYAQAARGKGKERHATGEQSFEDQPIIAISQLLGTGDGLRYQAIKKIHESKRLDMDSALREIYGAIVYLAGLCVLIEGGGDA